MIYCFRASAKWVGAACVGMALAALTNGTVWSQSEEAVRASQVLTNWLTCQKCEQGQLEAVVRNGEAIRPILMKLLLNQPSPPSREVLRRELGTRYEQLVEYSKKNPNSPLTAKMEQFVELYYGNSDVQHRVRAVQALAAIGGSGARAALQTVADEATQNDEVRAAARDALSRLPQ
jgi:hypothetical protein